MCDICHSNPHRKGCPNAPDEPIICPNCGTEIDPGEDVWHLVCPRCKSEF